MSPDDFLFAEEIDAVRGHDTLPFPDSVRVNAPLPGHRMPSHAGQRNDLTGYAATQRKRLLVDKSVWDASLAPRSEVRFTISDQLVVEVAHHQLG